MFARKHEIPHMGDFMFAGKHESFTRGHDSPAGNKEGKPQKERGNVL